MAESPMTEEQILEGLAAGRLTPAEAKLALEKVRAEPPRGSLYCKVSEKGGISVYGLQRMPVTLYVEQWLRLLDFGDEIRQFAKEHDAALKKKTAK